MCGIAGIIHPNHKVIIEMMTQAIAHRGPDDVGSFSGDHISLGHRRLSIQDLSSNGHQPMFTEDRRYCIVFNGEIYNHWDIRRELAAKYSFKSTSDTETILCGYQEYGVDLFNRLNGIFAFALLDTEKNELMIVRDQFGVKPLYYYHDKNCFIFSSELKSIVCTPDINLKKDLEALTNYLHFLYSPGENTPFLEVKKILPGHYIKFKVSDFLLHTQSKQPENFNIVPTKYYEIPFGGNYSTKTEAELIEELDTKLFEAVKRQLLSDVPIGFFLSGGLDSSLIVAIAKQILPSQRLMCFTIDANLKESNEGFADDLPYAKNVAEYLDVDLQIVQAKVDIVKDFDKMIYYLDEPQADAAPINVLNICKAAREQGVIVLLGGTAGDDLFSGYRRHQAIAIDRKLAFVPDFLKHLIWKISNIFPSNYAVVRRAKKLFSLYKENGKERQFASLYGWLPKEDIINLFKEKDIAFDPVSFLVNSLKNIPHESSLLNKMLYWEMKYFLTDHNLNYTDKMSMAHGVEVRVPFLDVELVNFAASIPPELKMKGTTTKYLLRKVAERYLPHNVIYRPKSGFGAPVREWITNDLDAMIDDYLSKESIEKRGIFDYSAVSQLVQDNKKGKIDASYSIWCLLAIESWMRQFADK